MKLSEARELVRKFPKRIGTFRREKVKRLRDVTVINFMSYDDTASHRFGFSVGDGKVYAAQLEKVEGGGKVLVPNLEQVLA